MKAFILLQQQLTASADSIGTGGVVEEPSLLKLAVQGGWVMIPIAILSIIAVYIFFERFNVINKASKIDINFMNRIKEYIHESKLDSALALCKSYTNPIAHMIETGINRIGRPLRDVETSIENVGKLEIYKLEKGLPLLATCAGAAPMLGFLGTVMGMISAFHELSSQPGGDILNQLSNGIYQALVTTVAGLIVGIIAYFAYNILVARVEKVIFQLEASTTEFMDLLNEPVKK
jgi:biopolymer transport protein ExbB